jgi:small-conductance mechanosensitive channel
MIAGVKITMGSLLTALILLLFATRLSRLAARFIHRRLILKFVNDKALQNTYYTFAFYACLAGFVVLSLVLAGIPLHIFTVLGGALAIGVGFGSQNIVNNFISGIILLVEQPIKVGDIIEIEGTIVGSVLSIGTRSTKVKNAENKTFIVPNSFLLEKSVLNWNYDSGVIRSSIKFGVAYGTDVKLVENICMDILLNSEGVDQNPVPQVFFNNFGDSNLEFEVIFWSNIESGVNLAALRSEIRFKIDSRFKDHKLEMAFPQRDINLKINRALEVKLLS